MPLKHGVVGDKLSNNLRVLQAKRMDWNSADVAVHTRTRMPLTL